MNLRLGHPLETLRPTLHNGPGWRVAVWVQGCSLRCTSNCLNPHLLDADGGHDCEPEPLLAAILASQRWQREPIEGVTVLGGEPLDQIVPLTEFLVHARRAGLTTMVYTGWTLDQLQHRYGEQAKAMLLQVDLLKAGPFQAPRYDATLPWRGSDNQQLLCLSDRYTEESLRFAWLHQRKSASTMITADGVFSHSGIQSRDAAAAVEASTRFE